METHSICFRGRVGVSDLMGAGRLPGRCRIRTSAHRVLTGGSPTGFMPGFMPGFMSGCAPDSVARSMHWSAPGFMSCSTPGSVCSRAPGCRVRRMPCFVRGAYRRSSALRLSRKVRQAVGRAHTERSDRKCDKYRPAHGGVCGESRALSIVGRWTLASEYLSRCGFVR
jgi:hypothetical protein